MPQRKRVLSGMRPTGRLHIGHYFGALQNWVRLQSDPDHECFFFIADWHALTTDYADTSAVARNTVEIAIDWLASGLDPEKCTMFLQSAVPEHAELHLLLSMVTPLGWLERVPTYKEAIENIRGKDLHTYGFLGYPVLQSADIVLYGEPNTDLWVPVGEDQVSHIELTREIVRRFNLLSGLKLRENLCREGAGKTALEKLLRALHLEAVTPKPADYQSGRLQETVWQAVESRVRAQILEEGVENSFERIEAAAILRMEVIEFRRVLSEPGALLTMTPRIPGTDGRKMSKSYNNAISLSESDESIRTKVRAMMTDPARKRRQDPGNPDVCPVFDWHKLFPEDQTPEKRARVDRISLECRTAAIGCVECKGMAADALIEWIEPVRARREEYAADTGKVLDILQQGSQSARFVAKNTMARVREAVFGWGKTEQSFAPADVPGARNMKASD
jgi:tryptophanyl-tRNA synthetase